MELMASKTVDDYKQRALTTIRELRESGIAELDEAQGLWRDPLLLRASAGLYFVCFVPLVWSLQPAAREQKQKEGYAFALCDVSLACLQAGLWLYRRGVGP